jgi:hypothetical protein
MLGVLLGPSANFLGLIQPTREQSLEVVLAQMDALCDFPQVWLAPGIRIEEQDSLLDSAVIFRHLFVIDHR